MHQDQIKQFILTELIKGGNGQELSEDDNLIDNGIVDSLGIMKLVSFLESSYKLSISDDEILIENFETINIIANFISSKLSE